MMEGEHSQREKRVEGGSAMEGERGMPGMGEKKQGWTMSNRQQQRATSNSNRRWATGDGRQVTATGNGQWVMDSS